MADYRDHDGPLGPVYCKIEGCGEIQNPWLGNGISQHYASRHPEYVREKKIKELKKELKRLKAQR